MGERECLQKETPVVEMHLKVTQMFEDANTICFQ